LVGIRRIIVLSRPTVDSGFHLFHTGNSLLQFCKIGFQSSHLATENPCSNGLGHGRGKQAETSEHGNGQSGLNHADAPSVQTCPLPHNTPRISNAAPAIPNAIETAQSVFTAENQNEKALVIITDGENHEGDVIAATQKAVKAGMRIFTIGVGTAEG
jgi:hypothetical protein